VTTESGAVVLRSPGVLVSWAAGGSAALGQSTSGDRHLVRELAGAVMIGLVDALGHGPRAAEVADLAVAALGASSATSPAARAADCHRALTATRGAVLALACIDATGAMTWTSVGNIETVLVRRRAGAPEVPLALVPRPGVLGMRHPAFVQHRRQLEPGDLLVMASDGVDQAFAEDVTAWDEPAGAVRRIVARRLLEHDDSLVLVARFEAAADDN
jgi:hypothetical protein